MYKKTTIFILISSLLLSACATTNPDPLQGYNRAIHTFNRQLDKYALKPVAKVYKAILPEMVIRRVTNFFSNISEIPGTINYLLQADLEMALNAAWRFGINTTIGILGLFDPASDIDLYHYPTDLGITFKKWGYENSTYFVLPLFGPSTIRDAIALPINYYFFTIYPHIDDKPLRYGLIATNIINRRSVLLDIEDVVEKAAIDRYIFERDAYLQRRDYLSGVESEEDDLFLNDDDEYYID